ncbi:hypothetical protein HK101_007007 [Irineochytrium annulatum]|nr:hypothetical protein HK101_007007 [Irineochytrium annulatum]
MAKPTKPAGTEEEAAGSDGSDVETVKPTAKKQAGKLRKKVPKVAKVVSRSASPPPLDPKDAQALFQSLAAEADKLATGGFFAEALDRYTRALEFHPDDVDCLVNRSRCSMMLGDTASALSDAELSLQRDPNFIRGIFQKAESLYARGDFEDALVLYHRGRRVRPEMDGFHVGVAKSTEAIRSAVALLDPGKLRDKRAKVKARGEVEDTAPMSAAKGEGTKKVRMVSVMGGGRGGAAAGGGGVDARGRGKEFGGMSTQLFRTRSEPGMTVLEKEMHERNLLEELYEDKVFLEELRRDDRFMMAGQGAVKSLVGEGLRFIDGRVEFWRQRNPSGVSAAVMAQAESKGPATKDGAKMKNSKRRLPFFIFLECFIRKLPQGLEGLLATLVRGDQQQVVGNDAGRWNTWCGLHYEVGSPAVVPPPPWADTPRPETADFMIRPRLQPYVGEAKGSLLVTPPYLASWKTQSEVLDFMLEVSVEGRVILSQTIKLRSRREEESRGSRTALDIEVPFDLPEPRMRSYRLDCTLELVQAGTALASAGKLSTIVEVLVLPEPAEDYTGSVVRIDAKTGGTIVEYRDKSSERVSKRVYPYGHYTQWTNYLLRDINLLDVIKREGYTIVHPIPPAPDYEDFDFMEKFLDRAFELGLFVQYDMRHSFRNWTLLKEQVTRFKSKPALLTWYTADEPDGTSDPPSDVTASYEHIRVLDPYRPVSLVLNCLNFGTVQYAAGTDIVMSDVYMISNNNTFSTVWGTPCNATYGCCGCDQCTGNVNDVSTRFETLRSTLYGAGKE